MMDGDQIRVEIIRQAVSTEAVGKGLSSNTEGAGSQTGKIWGICKEIRVTHSGDEAAMVKVVEELEVRDRLAMASRGVNNGES